MSRTTRALLSLALVLSMSLGAGTALAQSPEPDPVLGQELTLTQLAGTDVASEAGITATFAADGSLSGFGGCNTYSATWQSDGTTLTVGAIAATLMACDATVDALESQYLSVLQAAASWSLNGSAVEIVATDGSTLVYGGDGGEVTIVGSWQVESVDGATPPAGATATADFAADGSLTGFGGCNTYSGTWTSDGSTLSISQLAATRVFCEGVSAFESSLLDALQGATSWAVDGETLTIDGIGQIVLGNGGATSGTLSGQDWLLVSIDGTPTDPSLGIDAAFFDDGAVAGFAGCNQYHASYTVDGDSLTLGRIGMTRKLCAEDENGLESDFLTAMQTAASFSVTDSDLTITSTAGSTLAFRIDAGTTPSPEPSARPTVVPSLVPSAAPSPAASAGR